MSKTMATQMEKIFSSDTIFPTQTNTSAKFAESQIFLFLEISDKMKHQQVYQTYENGGFRWTKIETFVNSIRIGWLIKIFKEIK